MPRTKRKRTPARAPARIEASLEAVPDELALPGEVTVLEAAAGDGGEKPPRLKIVAYTGGVLEMDEWPAPVVAHLDGLRLPKSLPVLADHDRTRPLGHGSPAIIEGRLQVDGLVSMPQTNPVVRDFVASAKIGFPWQASIGARPTKIAYHDEGSEFEANGQNFKAGNRGLYEVQEAALREVSICTLGADQKTKVAVAARAAANKPEDENMNFDQWLKARGKDPAKLSDVERTDLQAQFDAEQSAPPPAPTPTPPAAKPAKPADSADPDAMPDAIRARAVEDERKRVVDIEAACKGLEPETVGDLKAKAMAGDLTPDGLRHALLDRLRESRPAAPTVLSAHVPADLRTLEAALCLGYGVAPEKDLLVSYGEETLNTADRYRTVGFRRTLEMAAAMGGVELPISVDAQWIRAAFSTSGLSGIVGNVANKALAAAFSATRQIAPRIARAASHVNFHTHTVYSLALSGDLEEVGPTGELKHLELSEESWTRQVKTRGAVLSISRTDVVNDELGAFVDNARRLGRKAAVARERATALLLNATGAGTSFFTTAHKNYQAGADTALAIAALTAAVQLFRDQTGPSKDPVSIEPRILLVPTALEEPAKALMDRAAQMIAVALGSTTAKEKAPNVNVWAGQFEPLAWEWLSKTIGKTAGSSTGWYLLADPNDVPAVELAYLNGRQEPVVEYFGLSQEVSTLGVSWRVYYDFGAALAEYRAGVKSKGA